MLSDKEISSLENGVSVDYYMRGQIKEWAKNHKNVIRCVIDNTLSPWSEYHQPKYPSFNISIKGYSLQCRCFPSTCSTLIVNHLAPKKELFDAMEDLAKIFEYTQIMMQATIADYEEMWSFFRR